MSTIELEVPTTESIADRDLRIRKEVRQELEGDFIKKYEQAASALRESNRLAIDAALEDLRKNATPPTPSEIETTLNQEYVTFRVSIPIRASETKSAYVREFELVELPIAVEKKFYKIVGDKIKPRLKDLTAFDGSGFFDGDLNEKFGQFQSLFDPSLDLLCDVAALVLNPYDEDKEITSDWVSKHLASWRIWNLVMAQININRVRDFFSVVFRDSSAGRMITKVGSPA